MNNKTWIRSPSRDAVFMLCNGGSCKIWILHINNHSIYIDHAELYFSALMPRWAFKLFSL